jgi:DNA-3-methyladenine glycosylase I
MHQKKISRCAWVTSDPLYIDYHDHEWGNPIHDDQKLFEFLILEGAQAGLSWITILKKRDNYRKCFDYFDAEKIARYDQVKINELLSNAEIVRNRLKISAAITNAQAYLNLLESGVNFSDFIWGFVNHEPIINRWRTFKDIPTKTAESDWMAKELKKRGFKFVGSTICYAFMQAVGLVDDHTKDCFKSKKTRDLSPLSEAQLLEDLTAKKIHADEAAGINHFELGKP